MEDLINAIQNWPVIVQGALGSALFWLILFVGQRISSYCFHKFSGWSKERREADIRTQILRYRALLSEEGASGAFYASILWYRASRDVIKGLIWLSLGLIFDAVTGVLGLVGFIGCLYYLFAALEVVKPLRFDGDIEEKIKELERELEKITET